MAFVIPDQTSPGESRGDTRRGQHGADHIGIVFGTQAEDLAVLAAYIRACFRKILLDWAAQEYA